jgi:hypothetical protein
VGLTVRQDGLSSLHQEDNKAMTTETTTTRAPRFFYMSHGRRTVTVAYQTTSASSQTIVATCAYCVNRISPSQQSDSFSKRTGREIALGRLRHSDRDIQRSFEVTSNSMRELHVAIAEFIAATGVDQAARDVARAYLSRR